MAGAGWEKPTWFDNFLSQNPVFFFEVTGLKDGFLQTQLELFTHAVE